MLLLDVSGVQSAGESSSMFRCVVRCAVVDSAIIVGEVGAVVVTGGIVGEVA